MSGFNPFFRPFIPASKCNNSSSSSSSSSTDTESIKEEVKEYALEVLNNILSNLTVSVSDTVHNHYNESINTKPNATWDYNEDTEKGTLNFNYIVGRDGANGSSADAINLACEIWPSASSQVGQQITADGITKTVTEEDVTHGYFEDTNNSYLILVYDSSKQTAGDTYKVENLKLETAYPKFRIVSFKLSCTSAITGLTSVDEYNFRVDFGKETVGTLIDQEGNIDSGITVQTSSSEIYLAGVNGNDTNAIYYSGSKTLPYYKGNEMHAGAYYQTSDERLKVFKGNLNLTLDLINSIPLKYFTWKNNFNLKIEIGTSAQMVRRVAPEIVAEGQFLSVDYSKLSILALQGIKLLTKEIEELKTPWYIKLYNKIRKFF